MRIRTTMPMNTKSVVLIWNGDITWWWGPSGNVILVHGSVVASISRSKSIISAYHFLWDLLWSVISVLWQWFVCVCFRVQEIWTFLPVLHFSRVLDLESLPLIRIDLLRCNCVCIVVLVLSQHYNKNNTLIASGCWLEYFNIPLTGKTL